MEHQKFKELLQLFVYEELDREEKMLVENHLLECSDCNKELESIRQLYVALVDNRPEVPSDQVLDSARMELIRSIRKQKENVSLLDKFIQTVYETFFANYKVAFGGIATLAVGIFIGYLFFPPGNLERQTSHSQNTIKIDDIRKMEESGFDVSNIRFPNPFSDEGEIEFSFDAVKPISYTGNVNDEFTQKLLATALITANNPGIRLKTLNTIASQPEEEFKPDNQVKRALISALKVDENPGVRREALNVLGRFPYDDDIKDAFLFVLSNDNNSGLRVAAINALTDLKAEGISIDEKMKNILNKHVKTEENEFIKLRTASILQEVK
jgi:hypothetical protein